MIGGTILINWIFGILSDTIGIWGINIIIGTIIISGMILIVHRLQMPHPPRPPTPGPPIRPGPLGPPRPPVPTPPPSPRPRPRRALHKLVNLTYWIIILNSLALLFLIYSLIVVMLYIHYL